MIVITGTAGFIGARLLESFTPSQKEICSVDIPLHFVSRREHRKLQPGRIFDPKDFLKFLRSDLPKLEVIFHMGACSDTTETRWDYLKETNLEYSQTLWNYCSENKIPFIYASSAATYGAGEKGYEDDENHIRELTPLNLYGKSKQLFDLWALEQESKGIAPPIWAGLKFFNVYGFGERHKEKMASMVLKAFDQIQSRGSVRLFKSHHPDYRDGEQKRDFVYVDDIVQMVRFCFEKKIQRGIYNAGSGKARTFLDLVHAVFQKLEKDPKIEMIETPQELRNQYQYFTEAPMGKLKAAGYHHPLTPLESGVAQTVERLLADSKS